MTVIEPDWSSDREIRMVDAEPMDDAPAPLDEFPRTQSSSAEHYSPGNYTDSYESAPSESYHFVDRVEAAYEKTKSKVRKMMSGEDLLIAVMGMTGSGKTTFISKVTGRTDLKIGHDLTSCTQDINVVETVIDGRVVRFVDTPGFSDTHKSDTEILQLIAEYLASAYRQDVKLSGIIYLHPISDRRITHHAVKNLQMFQKLTGTDKLKNVVLVTTMWDKVSPEEGRAREQELKSNFWALLIAFEANVMRHAGTAESARCIAETLMDNKPFFVQLQQEMGKDNKPLKDTEAGKQLMSEIARMKEDHQKQITEMEAMMKNTAAENKTVVEALKNHYQGLVKDLENTLNDERRFNAEAVNSLKSRVEELEHRGRCSVM